MLHQRWQTCLSCLQQLVDTQVFHTWASPLRPLHYDEQENTLQVGVPSKTFVSLMREQIGEAIIKSIHQTFGERTTINWVVLDPNQSSSLETTTQPSNSGGYSPQAAPQSHTFDSRLNPHHSFDNFCEGESNAFAVIAAKAIAEVPGQNTFNPFFLFGASGVGKTHLVNAIGLEIKKRTPEKRVLFVSAQEFLTQYVEATTIHNKRNEFFSFYQNLDVLIIDDLHVIESKKGTETAFFHVFNHLLLLNRQIIITCDRAPSQFQDLEERMLTRFKMGVVQEILRPDIKLRRLFLTTKLRKENISLPPEVQDYIVENVSGSMRELQGTLNSLIFAAVRTNHCHLDLELTRQVVSRIVVEEVRRPLSFELILPAVCAHYKVKEADVKSKSRKAQHTAARQLIMYLTQLHTKASLSQIGRWLGGRDHSTVSHSCKLIEKRLNVENTFRLEVETLEQQLLTSPKTTATPKSRNHR